MTRLQVSFTIDVNQYIDLNIYQASYVFFYSNLSTDNTYDIFNLQF